MKFSLQLLLVAFMALANFTLVFCQDEFPPFGFEFNVEILKDMRNWKCSEVRKFEDPPDGGKAIAVDFKPPVFDPQLDLSIAPVGGHTVEGSTAVEALLTNNAMMSIDVLRPGSILDHRYISKANVYYAANNSELPYQGVDVYTNVNLTTDIDWITIPVGECKTAHFDVADSYDLSAGGDYYYQVDTYALARDSAQHDLQKSVRLVSNRLLAKDVDGALAAEGLGAQAKYDGLAKTDMRVQERGCGVEKQERLVSAQKWATKMAIDGAWYALFSDQAGHVNDWFVHFYHTSQPQARCYVIDMLIKVAEALYGWVHHRRIDCTDPLRMCDENTMAYTEVRNNMDRAQIIHVCPAVFDAGLMMNHDGTAGRFDLALLVFIKASTLPGRLYPGSGRGPSFSLRENVVGLPMAALLPWEVARGNADTFGYYIQWTNLLPHYPPA